MGFGDLSCPGITDGEGLPCAESGQYGIDMPLCFLDARQAGASSLMTIQSVGMLGPQKPTNKRRVPDSKEEDNANTGTDRGEGMHMWSCREDSSLGDCGHVI